MPRSRVILRNRKTATEKESSDVMVGFLKLEQVYSAMDLARAELERSTGAPICVEGCGKCCESMTPTASRLEAAYALANMSFLPSYMDIKARALRWMTDERPSQDYQALKSNPCSFLSDDKLCTIYEMRPLACRSYGVTTFAQADCPRPLHYTESDTNRMYIDESGPMGRAIKAKVQDMIRWIKDRNPIMSQVGFFPALIAQEMTPKAELAIMPISRNKMALRQAVVKGDSGDE